MRRESINSGHERRAFKNGEAVARPRSFLSAGLCGFEDAMRQAEPGRGTVTIFQSDRNHLNQGINLAGRFGDRERPAISEKQ